MKTLGLLLIVIGIIMMIFTGFTIVREKKVAQIGPVEINKNESTPVYWEPAVGGIILVAGIVLVIIPKRKG
jgi:hypothetical protein